jgi:hypothetical protein
MNSRLNSRVFLPIVLVVSLCPSAWGADTISGTVRNGSKNQPAANDQVILLRLDQGMQEEARAKTDALGTFTLSVVDPSKRHLVRVMHQDVNYDREALPGRDLAIDVFDASPKVKGVTGNIEILRLGTSGNLLHVSDLLEIKNESSPPETQAGKQTFEVYLPAQARIDSVMAAGPGGIGVLIAAVPVPGQPGHYTVSFPLRPGSTKFSFNYDLPYNGHATFRPKSLYPVQQLAVMTPPSMEFTTHSPAFHPLATGNTGYRVQVADQVKAGNGPEFAIAGAGGMPPLRERPPTARTPGTAAAALPATPATSTSTGAAAAGQHQSQPGTAVVDSSLRWWVLGGVFCFVAGVCGFLVWRVRRAAGTRQPVSQPSHADTFVETLKEELFQLEAERLRGSISQADYEASKRALEGTVKRALTKAGQT